MFLSDWINEFLLGKRAENLSPNTIRFYSSCLAKFARFCGEQELRTPEDVTARDFRRFLLWLETKGHNPGGIHAHYRICRTFFYWWEIETEPQENHRIFKKVKAPLLESVILPAVPLVDIDSLLSTCSDDWHGIRDRAALLTLLDTGARSAEFLGFDIEDIDLENKMLFIRKGKGRKSRFVFIGEMVKSELHNYLDDRSLGPLWITLAGSRLTYQGLRKMIMTRSKVAGIEHPTLHSFRRAFAVNMLRAGVDLETLRRLMGHANLKVLYLYLDLMIDDLQRAHALASPADQLRNLNERKVI